MAGRVASIFFQSLEHKYFLKLSQDIKFQRKPKRKCLKVCAKWKAKVGRSHMEILKVRLEENMRRHYFQLMKNNGYLKGRIAEEFLRWIG